MSALQAHAQMVKEMPIANKISIVLYSARLDSDADWAGYDGDRRIWMVQVEDPFPHAKGYFATRIPYQWTRLDNKIPSTLVKQFKFDIVDYWSGSKEEFIKAHHDETGFYK